MSFGTNWNQMSGSLVFGPETENYVENPSELFLLLLIIPVSHTVDSDLSSERLHRIIQIHRYFLVPVF
jgi:hypothetical protein